MQAEYFLRIGIAMPHFSAGNSLVHLVQNKLYCQNFDKISKFEGLNLMFHVEHLMGMRPSRSVMVLMFHMEHRVGPIRLVFNV